MKIPVECVTSICSFLNGKELANLSSTSVEMSSICSEPKLWVQICENEYKEWEDEPSKEEFKNRANLRKALLKILDENPYDHKGIHDLTKHPCYRYITSEFWSDAHAVLYSPNSATHITLSMIRLFQKQIYDERFSKILETEEDIIVVAAHLCKWNDNLVDPKEVLKSFQNLVKDAQQAEVQTVHQLCAWFSLQFQKPEEYYRSGNSFLHTGLLATYQLKMYIWSMLLVTSFAAGVRTPISTHSTIAKFFRKTNSLKGQELYEIEHFLFWGKPF